MAVYSYLHTRYSKPQNETADRIKVKFQELASFKRPGQSLAVVSSPLPILFCNDICPGLKVSCVYIYLTSYTYRNEMDLAIAS